MDPPVPDGSHLVPTNLNPGGGKLYEFGTNATYLCDSGLYFEHDREANHFNLTCYPGGRWQIPEKWTACVKSN